MDVLKRLLFCAGNDFVLEVPADIDKVIAETCDPDDKVAMFFGISLGLAQSFGSNNVELDMMALELEVGPYQGNELVEAFTGEHLRIKFHIQQCSPGADVVNSCCGLENSGRTFCIAALAG